MSIPNTQGPTPPRWVRLDWLLFILAATVAFFFVKRVVGDKSLNDYFLLVAYPLFVAWLLSFLSTRDLKRIVQLHVERSKKEIMDEVSRIEHSLKGQNENVLRKIERGRVICHGTKFEVPDRTNFWNDLLADARGQFILVGHTNKSWIDAERTQSKKLGDAIIRIIQSEGNVRILSSDTYKDKTCLFLHNYVYQVANKLPADRRRDLLLKLNTNLLYAVFNGNKSHYNAVVSDDRIMVMPTLNSPEFKDNSIVLEINRHSHPLPFKSYMDDVDRIIPIDKGLPAGIRRIELSEMKTILGADWKCNF